MRKLGQESARTGHVAKRARGSGSCARCGAGAEYTAGRGYSTGTQCGGSTSFGSSTDFGGTRRREPARGRNGSGSRRSRHPAATTTAPAGRDAEAG